jgi:putative ABC transport system permease protein
MLELEYREGNAVEAMAKLKQGGHLIVTDEFRQLKDIHVGSKLSLKTQRGLVDYTVAAVVWSPGLDVLVSWADMGRQFDQRTAASVFGSLEDAKRDFGIDRVYLFAANLEYGIQKEDLAQRMGQATSRPTTQTGGGFASFINAAAALAKKGFQVGDIRHIKHEMVTGFYRLLMLLSTVALAAIAVASLGVTNTIMASVRSRLWQFGILRSIGVTRSHLLRLILAEAVLLGCVACVLGTAAGMLMSVNAHQLSLLIVGYAPPMVIPWHILLLGIGLIIAVATAAAAWPAYDASRKEPLELLQWGRASA